MNLLNPPEVFDGGYWYVVPSVTDPVTGATTPGKISGYGWCAWFDGDFAVVRCPAAVEGIVIAFNKSVDSALSIAGLSGKPYGRIRGI